LPEAPEDPPAEGPGVSSADPSPPQATESREETTRKEEKAERRRMGRK
jgi:hypothetical protein